MSEALVDSVPAQLIHDEIVRLGVSHVLSVPDTHQKTLLASLVQDTRMRLLTFATEDEAICVNAGLWIGGAEPLLVIQNVGLFAGLNAIRGVGMDMKVPTCMLVGQFSRDVTVPVEQNRASGVRLIQPLLATMDIPCYVIDRASDLPLLARGFEQSRSERRPVVVLISAPTC